MLASRINQDQTAPSSGVNKVAERSALIVGYHDATLKIVTSRNLLFTIWYDAPAVPQLRQVLTAAKDLRAAWPKGVAQLNSVLKGTPRFSDKVRADAASIAKEKAKYVNLGLAYVVLAPGLAGTAAWAFMSTLALVSRTQVPTRVFRDLSEASQWIVAQLAAGDVVWSCSDLERVSRQTFEL
jgi:hypothetical protein